VLQQVEGLKLEVAEPPDPLTLATEQTHMNSPSGVLKDNANLLNYDMHIFKVRSKNER